MTPGPGAKWSEMAFVRHGPLSYPPHLTANKETKNTPRKPGDLGRRQNRHKRRNIRRAARPGQRRPFPEEAPGPARPRLLTHSRSAPVLTLGARRRETHCSCPSPIRPPLARGNEGQRRGLPPPHPSRGPVGSASTATPTCAGPTRASAAEPHTTASIEAGTPRLQQRGASRPRNVWHVSVSCACAAPPTRAIIERPRPPRRLEGPQKCRRCLAWTTNLTPSLQLPPPPCSLVC